jgi:hypothetical protein
MMEKTEAKFKSGEMVCAKTDRNTMLTIRRFIDEIYFCKNQAVLNQKERAFFERELAYP